MKKSKKNIKYIYASISLSKTFWICALMITILLFIPFLTFAQQIDENQYKISFKSRTFIPQPGIEPLVQDSLTAQLGRGERRHIIIQFTELPNRAEKQQLKAKGIRLLSYINGNAYYAAVDQPESLGFETLSANRDPALSLVRWMGEIENTDRVSTEVLEGKYGDWAISEDNTVKIRIMFFNDVDSTAEVNLFRRYTNQYTQHSPNIWQVSIDPVKVQELIKEDDVHWIEQEPPPYELLNDVTRAAIGVDAVQDFDATVPTYNGYSGDGIQVMIRDSGLDWDGVNNDHEDFDGRVLRTSSPWNAHGTHVAGTIGGSGFRSDLNDADGNPNGGTPFQWRGMAPNADLAAFSMGWDATTYASAIANYGIDISNHSHTQGRTSAYNTDTVPVENVVRDDALYIVTAVANNGASAQIGLLEGYYSIIGTVAKNALSVGSYNPATNLRSFFSSMGPTFDGRIKPEVVAPGHNIRSTVYDDPNPNQPTFRDDGYGLMGGTSMASPCAAGVVALMLEAFWDTFEEDNPRPFFSTMKAILIETAEDLVQAPNEPGEPDCPDFQVPNEQPPFYHAGPDWATGYGLINAQAAVEMIQDKSLYLQDEIDDIGATDEFPIYVPAGTPELKVTIAWDDYPGDPNTTNTSSKLVNDLNLRLIAPDGVTEYQPWVLSPLNPDDDGDIDPDDIVAATQGEDHLNNVEQVQVLNPVEGVWSARVDESGLPQPPQSYSLASNISINESPSITYLKWGLSAHSGTAIPTGLLADSYDKGFNALFNLEYRLTYQLSLVGYFGYNNFQSKISGVDDNYWLNLSLNLKYRRPLQLTPIHGLYYYIQAGPGYYIPKTGVSGLGANFGAGINYDFNSSITFESGTDYHALFDKDVKFWHAHAGIIIRF